MKLVDTHAHVFLKEMNFIANARYTPSYDALASQYIQQLDTNGFFYGVLIQPSFLGFDNTFMLEAIKQYPDCLKGVAVVPFDMPLDQLQHLKKQGIIGARLNLFGVPLPDLSAGDAKVFLQNLQALGWHLELHCPPHYLVQLLPQLAAFDVQVVIDHFGRIDPVKGVDDHDYQTALDELDPTRHWIKVSGYYRLGKKPHSIENAKRAYELFKHKGLLHRLVWGSDWPHTQHETEVTYEEALSTFKQVVTEASEQSLILGENALQLISLGD